MSLGDNESSPYGDGFVLSEDNTLQIASKLLKQKKLDGLNKLKLSLEEKAKVELDNGLYIEYGKTCGSVGRVRERIENLESQEKESSPQYVAYDFTANSVNPLQVEVPHEMNSPPPFVHTANWLDAIGNEIRELSSKSEDLESNRIPPMALVRCSRGGKTRALFEIGKWLKEKSLPTRPSYMFQ